MLNILLRLYYAYRKGSFLKRGDNAVEDAEYYYRRSHTYCKKLKELKE